MTAAGQPTPAKPGSCCVGRCGPAVADDGLHVVPAGEFDAFRIEGLGWGDSGQRMDATYWVVPGINPFYVRRDLVVRGGKRDVIKRSHRHELVSYQQ